MKKQANDNTIVAKCDDGAFRKITLIDHKDDRGDGTNAWTTYGVQGLVYGTYASFDDQPMFKKVG